MLRECWQQVVLWSVLLVIGHALPLASSAQTAQGETQKQNALHNLAVPDDAVTFEDHAYKYFAEQLSWKDARDKSAALGGYLVIIDSAKENEFVADLVAKAGSVDSWIGITDEAKEGEWMSVEGTPLAYRNWFPKQPNNKSGEEHYGLMTNQVNPSSGIPMDWTWCDQPSKSKQHKPGYVCEWSALPTLKAGKMTSQKTASQPYRTRRDMSQIRMPRSEQSTTAPVKSSSETAAADFELLLRVSGKSGEPIKQVRPALQRLDELIASSDKSKSFEATVKLGRQQKTFDNPKEARTGMERMLLTATDAVCRKYGVSIIANEVRTFNHGSYWETKPPRKDDVLIFGRDVVLFLSNYPVEAIRRGGLRNIVLCQEATTDGKHWPFGSASQDTILWPLKDLQQDTTDGLEHELFHVFDQTAMNNWGISSDTEWTALNPAGFVYKGYEGFLGTEDHERKTWAERKAWAEPVPAGFVSVYAAASEWEDKAETYYAMTRRSKWLEGEVTKNHHVAAKVELIERRMRLLSPTFKAGFWKEARE